MSHSRVHSALGLETCLPIIREGGQQSCEVRPAIQGCFAKGPLSFSILM